MLRLPDALPDDSVVRRVALAGGQLASVDAPAHHSPAQRKRHRDINRALGEMQDRGHHFVQRFRARQEGSPTLEVDLQHLRSIRDLNFPQRPRPPRPPRDRREEARRRLWRQMRDVRDEFAALDEYELETAVEGDEPPPPPPPPLPPRIRPDPDFFNEVDDDDDGADDDDDDDGQRERRRMMAAIRKIEVYKLALFHAKETDDLLRSLRARVARRQGGRLEAQQRRCFDGLEQIARDLRERMGEFRECFASARSSARYDPRGNESVVWETPRAWGFATFKPRCRALAEGLHATLERTSAASLRRRDEVLRLTCATNTVSTRHGHVALAGTPRKMVRLPHGGSHLVQPR